MFSHTLLVILGGLLLASFVNTQANAQLDPSSVPLDQRKTWCQSQISACDTLCSSVTDGNDCTSETLNFTCQCSNYPTPPLPSYSGTIPTLTCQQLFSNCKKDAGTAFNKIYQCNVDFGLHCGRKSPVDFEPPATSSSAPTTTSDALSTDHASTASASSSDQPTTASSTTTVQTTRSSTSPTPTDTLATSTTPKSTPTDVSLGAQNTTAPIPANAPQMKGKSDLEIMAITLGVLGGVAIVVLVFLWKLGSWRERRAKEKEEAEEADRRSIRSNRGSVLMMREMSADAIRAYLSKIEGVDEGAGKPKEIGGAPVGPAELPSHFPRSHSRLFEMD